MRSKMLLFLTAATVVVVILSKYLLSIVFKRFFADWEPSNFSDVALEMFLLGISFWTIFLALFLGITTVRGDLEDGVLRQLLSFPIKRFEYLMARILGVSSIVSTFYLFSLGIFLVIFAKEWGIQVNTASLLLAFVINTIAIVVVVGLAVSISLFAKGILAFGMGVFLVFLLFLSNNHFGETHLTEIFKDTDTSFSLVFCLGLFLHFCFPRIGVLSGVAKTMALERELSIVWWQESVHLLLTFGMLCLITVWFLRKKEI